MFSGGPNYVGSVIHAFESLAHRRQLQEGAEKPYESSKSSSAEKKDSIYKIILPPPPSYLSSAGMKNSPKQVVRHRPKGKAPDASSLMKNKVSATKQSKKLSVEENESSALDSLNMVDEFHQMHLRRNLPQPYTKIVKVLPPFQPAPSRIPTKIGSTITAKYSEDDVEKDFLRGSTVSQSFIRKTPERTISTYEQNFLANRADWKPKKKVFDKGFSELKSKSISEQFEQPLIDAGELTARYTEYGNTSGNSTQSILSRQRHLSQSFQPPSPDRAVI